MFTRYVQARRGSNDLDDLGEIQFCLRLDPRALFELNHLQGVLTLVYFMVGAGTQSRFTTS